MTTFNISDHELHARASAYAVQHRVSYSQALDAMVSFAELSHTPAPQTSTAPRTVQMTDAELDAAAKRHAAQHGVSYSQALTDVVQFSESQQAAAPQSSAASSAAPMTDAELDVAAKRYAAQAGVDYLTALGIVSTGRSLSAASPASQASAEDQRVHAAALAYSAENKVNYSEALSCVSPGDGRVQFSEGALDAAQLLESQPIEIFRAGTHVDNAGNSRVFSVADVQSMAAAYNPLRHEAPMVLGHPEHDLPAQGWVKGLQATADGRLLMQAAKIDPEFAQSVQSGRYKKRSASFYPPSAQGNPAPGQWYLRHVGWLGAQPPAIKGLSDVQFGAGADNCLVVFS